ncbi:MAG TPA: hypothetical protein VEB19_10940 [Gemmatimonadaceae bacterium]|nr:hypothetical protein [Gemmatimonadaceae bacterium]
MTTSLIPTIDARAALTPEVAARSIREQFMAEVFDAHLLFQYATSTGKNIPDGVINDMTMARMMIAGEAAPDPEMWGRIARAHRHLAELSAPVTAATLRATADEFGTRGRFPFQGQISVGKRWNRSLWMMAIGFALAILAAENYSTILGNFFARDENTSDAVLWRYILDSILQTLMPFAYGALGAATYLLRSAHLHIHARTFDANFIPEYYGRLLLGMVAGGTINLLIDSVTQDGTVIHLSAAALAFVAGYSADLLFRTVERITEALLPRVGVDSLRRASPAQVTGMSLPALLEQLDRAQTPEARQTIQGLISKIRERL